VTQAIMPSQVQNAVMEGMDDFSNHFVGGRVADQERGPGLARNRE